MAVPTAPLSAFPLPLSEFWSDLRFAAWTPDLTSDDVQNVTEAGEPIVTTRGARLWRWTCALAPMQRWDADALHGRLAVLSRGFGSFLATPPFNSAPAGDPGGLFLGAAAPVIASLPAGGRTLTLSGLPGHYRLTAGDFIAWTRDTPARYELHRIVTSATASAAGVTPVFEVVPAIRPGVLVGAAVTLRAPAMRAIIAPGSLRMQASEPGPAGGLAFDVLQTLRKAG